MKPKIGIALIAGLLIAGCGGSSAGGGGSAGSTPESVATTIGCTGLASASSQELYVQGLKTCQVGGEDVSIYTFASKTDADNWYAVAKGFIGEGKLFRVGDTIIVSADGTGAADAIRGKLG